MSLWYVILNKKEALIDLFMKEKKTGGDKVAAMLQNDFKVDRWKKAAFDNGMRLRNQQRYTFCVTFFLLGNFFKDAVSIILGDMKDPILAILVCRMMLLIQPTSEVIQ